MFSRLVAFSCSVTVRLPPMRTSRENCAFSCLLPGPMITFLDELPNRPGGGSENAAVLKN